MKKEPSQSKAPKAEEPQSKKQKPPSLPTLYKWACQGLLPFKVVFEHWRVRDVTGDGKPIIEHYQRPRRLANGEKHPGSPWTPLERGGHTFCRLLGTDDKVLARGDAKCHFELDSYHYFLGAKISFGRALKKLGFSGRAGRRALQLEMEALQR